jgi:PKD repeat protein
MGQQSQSLEELFKNAFQNHTQMPSARILRRLRFRLWMTDFFSLNPKKFNIYYSALLTGSIITVAVLNGKSNLDNHKIDNRKVVVEEKIISKTDIDLKVAENSTIAEKKNNNSESKDGGDLMEVSFNSTSREGCVPLNIAFYDMSKNAKTVNWDFGDGSISSDQNPNHIYNKSGNYKVTLSVIGTNGQRLSSSKEITVLEKPMAAMKLEMDNSGNSKEIVFKNASKGASSYSWDFGDNNVSIEENTKHAYSTYGTYYVTLVATSENGCKDTARLNNNYIDKDYELAFPFNFRPNTAEPGNNGYYENEGTQTFIFYPKNNGAQKYELKIFAPNGTEVFSTSEIRQGWNGYFKGRLVPAGVYTYEAKGAYPNGKPFGINGKVKVIVDDLYQN